MAKYRILSIDGGGLRGLIPVLILKRIEELTGERIHKSFDLIAGTSTGGLIACALTVPDKSKFNSLYSLTEIEKVFTEQGSVIFSNRKCFPLNVSRPRYSSDALRGQLIKMFNNLYGETNTSTIFDLLTPVIIPAYDLGTNRPVVFKSRHAELNHQKNATLVDVCLATSAAPTYFPGYPFKYGGVKNPLICIDGGVYMNNPSLDALIEMLDPKSHEYYGINDKIKNDFFLLSIGTGDYLGELVNEERAVTKGGFRQWAKPISDVMMYAGSQSINYKAKRAIDHINRTATLPHENHYLRLSINIDDKKHKGMDDSSKATKDYLLKEFKKQFTDNGSLQQKLKVFIENSKESLV